MCVCVCVCMFVCVFVCVCVAGNNPTDMHWRNLPALYKPEGIHIECV